MVDLTKLQTTKINLPILSMFFVYWLGKKAEFLKDLVFVYSLGCFQKGKVRNIKLHIFYSEFQLQLHLPTIRL